MKDVLKNQRNLSLYMTLNIWHPTMKWIKDHKGFFGIPYAITECYNTNHTLHNHNTNGAKRAIRWLVHWYAYEHGHSTRKCGRKDCVQIGTWSLWTNIHVFGRSDRLQGVSSIWSWERPPVMSRKSAQMQSNVTTILQQIRKQKYGDHHSISTPLLDRFKWQWLHCKTSPQFYSTSGQRNKEITIQSPPPIQNNYFRLLSDIHI